MQCEIGSEIPVLQIYIIVTQ